MSPPDDNGTARKMAAHAIKRTAAGGESRVDVMSNAALARILVAVATRRQAMFGAHLFADPAWDILLSLYLAHEERRPVSMSSACLASGVPESTALRFVRGLVDSRLIEEQPDPLGGGRSFLRLTARGRERLEDFLSGVPRVDIARA